MPGVGLDRVVDDLRADGEPGRCYLDLRGLAEGDLRPGKAARLTAADIGRHDQAEHLRQRVTLDEVEEAACLGSNSICMSAELTPRLCTRAEETAAVATSKGMSTAEIYDLPASVDLPVACAALGIGRTLGYQLAKADEFPCRGAQGRREVQGPPVRDPRGPGHARAAAGRRPGG